MATCELLAELRRSRTDLARLVEVAAEHADRPYVVVPAKAVTAWMEREPDAWAKVLVWLAANGKRVVQV